MNLSDALITQAEACENLDSPFMGRLLRVLIEIWPPNNEWHRAIETFTGDIGPVGHSLPLRLAAGLHALVLAQKCPELSAVYPPNLPSDDALKEAVSYALNAHCDHLLEWLENPPQTNEVRRSAVLIAAASEALAHFPQPIVLSELGASAGLNLMWDRFALNIKNQSYGSKAPALTLTPDWHGPSPVQQSIKIANRAGVDLSPFHLTKDTDRLRLCSYLWADQPERLALSKAAMSVHDVQVHQGDAIDWLAQRLHENWKGHLHIIQNTVAWQYFPKEAQARGLQLIEESGNHATSDNPIAWISMEADGQPNGASVTLRLWPGNKTIALGRADFHGRWVHWFDRSSNV